MYQPKIFLKVMAIFGIISGVMGAISTLTANKILEMTESMTGISTGLELSMVDIVLGVVFSVAIVIAGILSLMGKQWKVVGGIILLYVIYSIYGIITTSMMIGFTPLSMTNLIFPILFGWSLFTSVYESRE